MEDGDLGFELTPEMEAELTDGKGDGDERQPARVLHGDQPEQQPAH